MTTSPVLSITDEQIAEIEEAAESRKAEGFLLVHNLSCHDLLALIARLRAAENDSARLDKLDGIVEAYGFEVHEGNRWVIDGPFRDIHTAIDAMSEAKP